MGIILYLCIVKQRYLITINIYYMKQYLLLIIALLLDWSVGAQTLTTPWTDKVDRSCPRAEYPRPILQRSQWLCLNGQWDYAIQDRGCVEPLRWDGSITVPYCLESQLSGVQKSLNENQELWYRREFSVPASWKGKQVMLNFDAVDWEADVYVNDVHVGSHRGGYTAFGFDITPFLNAKGSQKLVVRVYDPTNKGYQAVGKQTQTPGGIWYTAVSGIWQSVWLEPVSRQHITHVSTSADLKNSVLSLTLQSSGDEGLAEVQLIDREGRVVATAKGRPNSTLRLHVPETQLWSPEHPYLYRLKIAIRQDGRVIDQVNSYAAMRSISAARDWDQGCMRMQLNGRNYFHYGPLDQGRYPDGLYTAATDEAMLYDLQVTKQLGYNMVRKHVKVEPDRWYYMCDSLGLLVWQDMPSGDYGGHWEPYTYNGGVDRARTQQSIDNYYHEWGEIIRQCGQHPCVVVWVPFNEAWGQFATPEVVEWTHQQDLTRLINPASGGNHRACGDIFDHHHYPHPAMFLSDPGRVNVLGEYGGIGLPLKGHLWNEDKNWGYVKFQSKDEVTAEYVKYAQQLKDYVRKGYSAAVYTQTSDVEGEVNGLLTYDRRELKVDAEAVRRANQEVIAIVNNNNKDMKIFTLTNRNGMTARITNYGGRIMQLLVPDRDGKLQDVVLGFDEVQDYLRENHQTDFGAAIGRYANRLGNGQITVAGKTFQLPQNNGPHCLHGGPTGWQYQLFDVEGCSANSLVLTLVSPDGDNDFPGEVRVRLTYTLTDDNRLDIQYAATTDAPTVINMTNHSYFNLNADGNSTILNHLLSIDADQYTPIDETYLPIGVKEPVAGTPFDFRKAKSVGQDIAADNQQLRNGNGYDHNWVLNTKGDISKPCARLESPVTGIVMDVYTTEPGMQVYTGNFLNGGVRGKGGIGYAQRTAICLETQKYPNSPNNQWAESNAYLNPGETYQSRTIFAFSTK